MTRSGVRRAVAAGALTAVALTGCGNASEDVKNHVRDSYELVSQSGQYSTYTSDDTVREVAEGIIAVAEPGRDHADETGRYLGYKDAMVHIDEGDGGGSEIEVTDPRDGYNRWGAAIIPVWGTFGGSYTSAFSGGGLGGGK